MFLTPPETEHVRRLVLADLQAQGHAQQASEGKGIPQQGPDAAPGGGALSANKDDMPFLRRKMDARLEKRPNRKPILRVFYDPQRRNWNACIREALDANGIKDRLSILVIAEPQTSGNQQ